MTAPTALTRSATGTTPTMIILASAGTPATATPELAPGPARRVLVIDDEHRVRDGLFDLLGPHHDVTVVDGGAAALALLETHTYDVILCDVMMPEMSGVDGYRTHAATRRGLGPR